MKNDHLLDLDYKFVSPALKISLQKLRQKEKLQDWDMCVDIPCGNGRNIFYLSSFFASLFGFDINENYLKSINESIPLYKLPKQNIVVRGIDLAEEVPELIKTANLVTVIHYFNYPVINRIFDTMTPNSYLYIETPGCHGDNHVDLPTENIINLLLAGKKVVHFKKRICNSKDSSDDKFAFACLMKKL